VVDLLQLDIFVILQAVFQPLQGLFDGLVYGLNDPTFTTNYKRLALRFVASAQYTSIQDLHCEYEYRSHNNYAVDNLAIEQKLFEPVPGVSRSSLILHK
jgi:hypothetical protein